MRSFVQWLLILCALSGAALADDDSSDSGATSASTAVGSAGGNSSWR